MAHIPDGFLSPPVLAGTTVLSATALVVAARRSRRRLGERQAPLLGALTAFVFAAQMFNFPLGAGTSAHLLGGVLVAVVAGPWAGMLALFSVILIQALLFQDGGITALGANTLNMAVLGAGGGYLIYRWLRAVLGGAAGRQAVAAGLAGFLSALLTGTAVAAELTLSRVVPWHAALVAVVGAHVFVGLGEGILTGGIVALVLRSRPELIGAPPRPAQRRRVLAVSAVALVVAVLASQYASRRPDALQSAAHRLGLVEGPPALAAPLAGYATPVGGPWVAAGLGVGVVFLVGWLLFRLAGRQRGRA